MKMDRWTAKQTKVLVTVWRENCKKLESLKQHSAWMQIKEKIDKLGNPKRLIQIKQNQRIRKTPTKFQKTIIKKLDDVQVLVHILMFLIPGRRDLVNPFAT